MLLKKDVELPGLKTSVKLSPSQIIRDDGYVDSMIEHSAQLCREIGYPDTEEYIFSEDFGLSLNWKHPQMTGGNALAREYPSGTKEVVLRYVASNDPVVNTHVRGHEEAHALEFLGELDVLSDLTKKVTGKDIDLEKVHPEVIGQIGGFLALRQRGINISDEEFLSRENIKTPLQYQEWTRQAYALLESA